MSFQTIAPTKQIVASGTQYFRQVVMTWSIRSRGSDQRTHIWRKTREQAFAMNTAHPMRFTMYRAVQLSVEREIDLPHAARPKQANNLERAEPGAGRQGHGCLIIRWHDGLATGTGLRGDGLIDRANPLIIDRFTGGELRQ